MHLINIDIDVLDASGILNSLCCRALCHMLRPCSFLRSRSIWWIYGGREVNSKIEAPHLDMLDVYMALGSLKPLLLCIAQWL
jgi:hypothetical protein